MNNKEIVFIITFFALSMTVMFIFNELHFRIDEGYFHAAAQRINDGEKLYKDFFFLYPPLLPFIYSLFLPHIQGISYYVATRVFFGIILFIMALVTYQISRKFLSKNMSFIATLTSMLVSYFKFPFLSPSYLANIFIILALWVVLNKEKVKFYHAQLAIISSLAILSKHNIGIYLCAGLFVYHTAIYLKEKMLKDYIQSLIALAAPLISFIVLIAQPGAYEQLIEFPKKYVWIDFSPIAFIMVQGVLIVLGSFVIYYFFRQKHYVHKERFALAVFTLAMLAQGALYRDFIHLLDGCWILPIFLLSCIGIENHKLSKYALVFAMLLLIILGLRISQGIWMNHFKGTSHIKSHHLFVTKDINDLMLAAEIISQKQNPYLLAYPNEAILYVLSGKKNPTHYNQYFRGYHNTTNEQNGVIATIQKYKPTITLYGDIKSSNYPLLTEYFNKLMPAQTIGKIKIINFDG